MKECKHYNKKNHYYHNKVEVKKICFLYKIWNF